MSISQLQGCLVLLNGFPGTGKLSIARELQSRLPDVETRLIDNHLIIDAAEAIHPGRGPEHKALRSRLRRTILDELKALPDPNTIIIMTLCLGAHEEDAGVYAEHVDIARSRSIPCYAFTVSCDKQQHMLRLQSQDRALGYKMKLTEPAVLERVLSNNEILDPTNCSTGYCFDVNVHLQHTLINTTELKLEQSAQRILVNIAPHRSDDHSSSEL